MGSKLGKMVLCLFTLVLFSGLEGCGMVSMVGQEQALVTESGGDDVAAGFSGQGGGLGGGLSGSGGDGIGMPGGQLAGNFDDVYGPGGVIDCLNDGGSIEECTEGFGGNGVTGSDGQVSPSAGAMSSDIDGGELDGMVASSLGAVGSYGGVVGDMLDCNEISDPFARESCMFDAATGWHEDNFGSDENDQGGKGSQDDGSGQGNQGASGSTDCDDGADCTGTGDSGTGVGGNDGIGGCDDGECLG